jgi:hypothetical protein
MKIRLMSLVNTPGAAQLDTAIGAGALLLLAAADSHMQTVALETAKLTVTPMASGTRAEGSRAL